MCLIPIFSINVNAVVISDLDIAKDSYKKQDFKDAMNQFTILANNGNAEAIFYLVGMYENGEGVEKNFQKSAEFTLKGANAGFESLQDHLGLMYENGVGVKQDNDAAINWYKKAADTGYSPAQLHAGKLYQKLNDYSSAAIYYLKAANQNDAEAQFSIGNSYRLGRGIQQSKNDAIYWYTKSAENGNANAARNLNLMLRE
jgi:TPR repeat protein